MFEEQTALFIYCVSPVHMGAGTALGVIDNPIQRERHTEYPMFAGSGLKGAVRHDFWAQAVQNVEDAVKGLSYELITRVFGPEPAAGASDHAGAISFCDAQLLLFPVRSIKQAFAYVSCPTVLARALRSLKLASVNPTWSIPEVQPGCCIISDLRMCGQNSKLPLESFEFDAKTEVAVVQIAKWLAANAIPQEQSFDYFRQKLEKDLVVVSDYDFGYFVRNCTTVEAHVRIDDVTGTATDTGLFYTENLPAESLLLTVALASQERSREANRMRASEVIQTVIRGTEGIRGLDGRMVQIGGDASTGRGQILMRAAGGKEDA